MEGSKSLIKRKTLTHCLAPIKVLGLVHVRREKRDRKIVGINHGPFLSDDRMQKVFWPKGQ